MVLIVRFVQGLAVLAILIGVVMFVVIALQLFGVSQSMIESMMPGVFEMSGFDQSGTLAKLAVTLISLFVALHIYMYYRLFRLFGEFAAKRYFSNAAVNHMRVFAGIYALTSLLVLFVDAISSDKLSLQASNISNFMFGLIFLIIAHILAVARKAHQELDNYF